ncbi:MAG: FeoB-associated Cys-rich membrane protein [Eubacteriales bacterium]|nr:FeoB-associated Cys-rich membrane protein [Clostridiales bacterium]MDD6340759.1 FeoB-associated Cys-rich membrane protein [Eubacteriales bacterium]MDY3760392.1 FeoB-associated Cys-rich membrane protein [Eubacteriales bacterium]
MLAWLSENLATVIICAALIAVIAAIVIRLILNKKKGRSSCGCGCDNCPMGGSCHQDPKGNG